MQNQSSSPCISVLRRRISRDRTPLTQRRWWCLHHASRLFEAREKTHHACPHLPEKRIRCRLACRPGHFFRPCVGVESQPVLLERKHRRDEMRGGKKLEKCNQRDFTFCQVGNLKVHQKQPTGSLIFFDPRYFGLLTPRAEETQRHFTQFELHFIRCFLAQGAVLQAWSNFLDKR